MINAHKVNDLSVVHCLCLWLVVTSSESREQDPEPFAINSSHQSESVHSIVAIYYYSICALFAITPALKLGPQSLHTRLAVSQSGGVGACRQQGHPPTDQSIKDVQCGNQEQHLRGRERVCLLCFWGMFRGRTWTSAGRWSMVCWWVVGRLVTGTNGGRTKTFVIALFA